MNAGTAVTKPIQKQFMRWEGGAAAATPIIDWVLANGGTVRYHEPTPHDLYKGTALETVEPEHLVIDTLEGIMRADVGDVIIRGVRGEFYPCKPDVFERTYDVFEEPA